VHHVNVRATNTSETVAAVSFIRALTSIYGINDEIRHSGLVLQMKGGAYSRPKVARGECDFAKTISAGAARAHEALGKPTLGLTIWAMSKIRPPTTA
jgi:hypothetical protein